MGTMTTALQEEASGALPCPVFSVCIGGALELQAGCVSPGRGEVPWGDTSLHDQLLLEPLGPAELLSVLPWPQAPPLPKEHLAPGET